MHELLLFGQVPASRHEQVLNVLAGFTAMQPQRVAELHQIYKPSVQPQQAIHVGGSQSLHQRPSVPNTQSRELAYMQLVESLHIEDGQQLDWPAANSEIRSAWSLQYYDLPDAAKRPVTLRMTSSIDIMEGDPHGYMTALGYNFVNSYLLEGYRLVYNNVVILHYRILRFIAEDDVQQTLSKVSGQYSSMLPLDDSGGYVLSASIRLGDRNKPDLITKGIAELEDFRRRMKGVVNLTEADRLSMDTRVK